MDYDYSVSPLLTYSEIEDKSALFAREMQNHEETYYDACQILEEYENSEKYVDYAEYRQDFEDFAKVIQKMEEVLEIEDQLFTNWHSFAQNNMTKEIDYQNQDIILSRYTSYYLDLQSKLTYGYLFEVNLRKACQAFQKKYPL